MQASTKRQLIDDIRRLNLGVELGFLMQFDESSLRQYLDRLSTATERSMRINTARPQRRQRLKKAS
jgi:NAD kinase